MREITIHVPDPAMTSTGKVDLSVHFSDDTPGAMRAFVEYGIGLEQKGWKINTRHSHDSKFPMIDGTMDADDVNGLPAVELTVFGPNYREADQPVAERPSPDVLIQNRIRADADAELAEEVEGLPESSEGQVVNDG